MFNSDLLPAQLFYLRNPSKASIDEVLAIIFKDLTLRRVLNYRKKSIYPTDRSKKTQKYFMFVKGENFAGYEAMPFEQSIINPFNEVDQIQLKTITNFVLKKYGLPSSFSNVELMGPLKKEGLISSVPILSAFGMKKVLSKGAKIIDELNHYLDTKSQELTACINQNNEVFVSILKEMGALIFFIKKDNPSLFSLIVENVKVVYETKPLGVENDLHEFTEAINIDTAYLHGH